MGSDSGRVKKKENKIGMCCFSAQHAALRSKEVIPCSFIYNYTFFYCYLTFYPLPEQCIIKCYIYVGNVTNRVPGIWNNIVHENDILEQSVDNFVLSIEDRSFLFIWCYWWSIIRKIGLLIWSTVHPKKTCLPSPDKPVYLILTYCPNILL
jgi:hypothetical protein